MKTRPQTILCAIVFALLMLAQSASAFYDASLGRWIHRDPIQEFGGINLYGFVRNHPVGLVDAHGLAWYDYLPIIGTLTSCFGSSPGENVADFARVASPGCKECKDDAASAEAACKQRMNLLAAGYLGNLAAPGLVKLGVDAIVAGLGTISVVGAPIGVAAAIDGVVGAACTTKTAFNIKDAAAKAKAAYCKCPESQK